MYVEHFWNIETRCGVFYRTHRGADMSTCWISDPAGSNCAGVGFRGGLPFWKELPLMDPGREAESTVTESGESEGNPSHTEVKLQDD